MIKNFVVKVNDCFNHIYYLQNIFSRVVICMFLLNMVYAKSIGETFLSLSFVAQSIFEIYLPCYYGSEMERSSDNLMDAIYQSDWLNCDLKTKKLIVKFMENLKRPMKINFYLIFDVKLELFAKIMNAAYSFYCVLSKLAERNH